MKDVTLYCIYQDRATGQGMAGIVDIHKTVSTPNQLRNIFPGIKFDHIIMEDPFQNNVSLEAFEMWFVLYVFSPALFGNFCIFILDISLAGCFPCWPK